MAMMAVHEKFLMMMSQMDGPLRDLLRLHSFVVQD